MQEEVQNVEVGNKNLTQNLDAVMGHLCIALVALGERASC